MLRNSLNIHVWYAMYFFWSGGWFDWSKGKLTGNHVVSQQIYIYIYIEVLIVESFYEDACWGVSCKVKICAIPKVSIVDLWNVCHMFEPLNPLWLGMSHSALSMAKFAKARTKRPQWNNSSREVSPQKSEILWNPTKSDNSLFYLFLGFLMVPISISVVGIIWKMYLIIW